MNLGMDKLKSAAVTDSRYKARVDCSGALPRKGCKREFVNGSSRIPVGEHRIRASIHATNPDGLFGWASLNHLEYVGTPIGRWNVEPIGKGGPPGNGQKLRMFKRWLLLVRPVGSSM